MTKQHTLRILQYNVRREQNTVMAALLNDRRMKEVDIIAIQEPWHNSRNNSSYNSSTSEFYLAYREKEGTRVCFYINKRIDINSWQVTHETEDLSTLKLESRESSNGEQNTITHIHNIYSPSPSSYNSQSNSRSLTEVQKKLRKPGEHIILGDFNLHHPQWNNPGRHTYHQAADELLNITMAENMKLLLPSGSITWAARGFESAIDLIFATKKMSETLRSCTVRQDLQHGSDHIPILSEFELETEKVIEKRRRA